MKYIKLFEEFSQEPNINNISDSDKKYITYLLEYVYYNNPDEEDKYSPTDAPEWIIKFSYQFLKNHGITKIYRGFSPGSYQDVDAYSWTYDKDVAKSFGDNIVEIPLPAKVVSVEYVLDWVKRNGYYPESTNADFKDYIDNPSEESEVIVVN
jgi:hypothetical protein